MGSTGRDRGLPYAALLAVNLTARPLIAGLVHTLGHGKPVRFGVDGPEYEIDLSKKNAAAFRRKLAPFIEHAHTKEFKSSLTLIL